MSPSITSNTDAVAATVNLDVSNLSADAALRALDTNIDGLVNVEDDLNGDGVIDGADVQLNAGTGTTGTAPTAGAVPISDALQALAGLDAGSLDATVANLTSDQLTFLKQECDDQGEAGLDATLVNACQVILAQ